ncbi:MAG: hypothetical protein AAF600_17580 [Bacteroidota bacterium]
MRVGLGFEPNVYHRKNWSPKQFSEEISSYWLEKGISPLSSGGVINLLNQIDQGKIEFRISEKMHAKLYVGIDHAFLGSSNLSKKWTHKTERSQY